jgi:hypothetical protein
MFILCGSNDEKAQEITKVAVENNHKKGLDK